MKKLIFTLLLAGVCLVVLPAFASDVVIVKMQPLNIPNSVSATLLGVNAGGTMVGWSVDTKGITHCLIVAGSSVQLLDHPATTDTKCYGINSRGDIVGSYLYLPTNKIRGFQMVASTPSGPIKFVDILPPAALNSWAVGINDRGHVVGNVITTDGKSHGYFWDHVTFKRLDHPNADGTEVGGINNNGMMTIRWWAPPSSADQTMHSSMYNGNIYRLMDMPAAKGTFMQGVTDTDDVILYFRDTNNRTRGAIMHNGQFYKFDPPGAANTFGMGISNSGLIVGGWNGAVPTNRGFAGYYVIQAEY